MCSGQNVLTRDCIRTGPISLAWDDIRNEKLKTLSDTLPVVKAGGAQDDEGASLVYAGGARPEILVSEKCVVSINYANSISDNIVLTTQSTQKEIYNYLRDQAANLYNKFNVVR